MRLYNLIFITLQGECGSYIRLRFQPLKIRGMSFLLKRTTKHNENYYPQIGKITQNAQKGVFVILPTLWSLRQESNKLLEGACQGCPNGTRVWHTDWGRRGALDPDVWLTGGHPGSTCTSCLGIWGSKGKWGAEGQTLWVLWLPQLWKTWVGTKGHSA